MAPSMFVPSLSLSPDQALNNITLVTLGDIWCHHDTMGNTVTGKVAQHMRAGFTGSRSGMDWRQRVLLRTILGVYDITELHHGDAVGADAQACDIAQSLDLTTLAYPCNIPSQRAFTQGNAKVFDVKPPLTRNKDIVNAVEMMIGMPSGAEHLQPRSGTWATIRYARGRNPIELPGGLIIIQAGGPSVL